MWLGLFMVNMIFIPLIIFIYWDTKVSHEKRVKRFSNIWFTYAEKPDYTLSLIFTWIWLMLNLIITAVGILEKVNGS